MTSWTWLLDKVAGGTPGHSAAWSLHVAGQGRRHEEHLSESDQVADVDHRQLGDQLNICIGCKGSPGSDGGLGRVPRSPAH